MDVGRWKNVVVGWPVCVWGGEQPEEADERQEEADEWQEEAEEQPGYINSHWKVDHKGTMVLLRDRKGIY